MYDRYVVCTQPPAKDKKSQQWRLPTTMCSTCGSRTRSGRSLLRPQEKGVLIVRRSMALCKGMRIPSFASKTWKVSDWYSSGTRGASLSGRGLGQILAPSGQVSHSHTVNLLPKLYTIGLLIIESPWPQKSSVYRGTRGYDAWSRWCTCSEPALSHDAWSLWFTCSKLALNRDAWSRCLIMVLDQGDVHAVSRH